MKPTAREIIESISWALDHRVEPQVEEKWAASSLRSIRCLLQHLAVRVEHEGQMLVEDNADLRDVLGQVVGNVGGVGTWRDIHSEIEGLLEREWRPPAAYPTVASLNEENEALQTGLDHVLVRLYRHGDGLDPATADALRAELDECLIRRVGREQPMFMPAFSENPLF